MENIITTDLSDLLSSLVGTKVFVVNAHSNMTFKSYLFYSCNYPYDFNCRIHNDENLTNFNFDFSISDIKHVFHVNDDYYRIVLK